MYIYSLYWVCIHIPILLLLLLLLLFLLLLLLLHGAPPPCDICTTVSQPTTRGRGCRHCVFATVLWWSPTQGLYNA